MPPKNKTAGKRQAPAKRKLAEEFPPGEILTDTAKKAWKLGPPVGRGGFGLIYLGNLSNRNVIFYHYYQNVVLLVALIFLNLDTILRIFLFLP